MFRNPFSFNGRIRRTEYGITIIIQIVLYFITILFASSGNEGALMFCLVLVILMIWLRLAQSVKRAHDIGNSGWFVLIPFYGLWLIFAEGNKGKNQYGEDPKIIY